MNTNDEDFGRAFAEIAVTEHNAIPVSTPNSIVHDNSILVHDNSIVHDKIRNTKVDFRSHGVETDNQDFEYTTSIMVLKDVVKSIGLDIDSLYGTSRCFKDTLMVLRGIKAFDMPLNFSTDPSKKSRLTIAYNQQGRNSRNINLGNFQSIEIVRLHCDNGITFHVAAVLVDCARSAKQKNFDIGAPMIIEYSQVISMAVNISRCFVLRDMNLLEVRKSIDSCSSTQEDKNVLLELLDQIIKLLPCCNVNDLTTQHWLGNNVIFGHIKKEGASKNMYQRATCKYKDGYEFTAVFDIVLQMLSVGLFTNNVQLWNSMYDRMFSNSEKMTDQTFVNYKLTN